MQRRKYVTPKCSGRMADYSQIKSRCMELKKRQIKVRTIKETEDDYTPDSTLELTSTTMNVHTGKKKKQDVLYNKRLPDHLQQARQRFQDDTESDRQNRHHEGLLPPEVVERLSLENNNEDERLEYTRSRSDHAKDLLQNKPDGHSVDWDPARFNAAIVKREQNYNALAAYLHRDDKVLQEQRANKFSHLKEHLHPQQRQQQQQDVPMQRSDLAMTEFDDKVKNAFERRYVNEELSKRYFDENKSEIENPRRTLMEKAAKKVNFGGAYYYIHNDTAHDRVSRSERVEKAKSYRLRVARFSFIEESHRTKELKCMFRHDVAALYPEPLPSEPLPSTRLETSFGMAATGSSVDLSPISATDRLRDIVDSSTTVSSTAFEIDIGSVSADAESQILVSKHVFLPSAVSRIRRVVLSAAIPSAIITALTTYFMWATPTTSQVPFEVHSCKGKLGVTIKSIRTVLSHSLSFYKISYMSISQSGYVVEDQTLRSIMNDEKHRMLENTSDNTSHHDGFVHQHSFKKVGPPQDSFTVDIFSERKFKMGTVVVPIDSEETTGCSWKYVSLPGSSSKNSNKTRVLIAWSFYHETSIPRESCIRFRSIRNIHKRKPYSIVVAYPRGTKLYKLKGSQLQVPSSDMKSARGFFKCTLGGTLMLWGSCEGVFTQQNCLAYVTVWEHSSDIHDDSKICIGESTVCLRTPQDWTWQSLQKPDLCLLAAHLNEVSGGYSKLISSFGALQCMLEAESRYHSMQQTATRVPRELQLGKKVNATRHKIRNRALYLSNSLNKVHQLWVLVRKISQKCVTELEAHPWIASFVPKLDAGYPEHVSETQLMIKFEAIVTQLLSFNSYYSIQELHRRFKQVCNGRFSPPIDSTVKGGGLGSPSAWFFVSLYWIFQPTVVTSTESNSEDQSEVVIAILRQLSVLATGGGVRRVKFSDIGTVTAGVAFNVSVSIYNIHSQLCEEEVAMSCFKIGRDEDSHHVLSIKRKERTNTIESEIEIHSIGTYYLLLTISSGGRDENWYSCCFSVGGNINTTKIKKPYFIKEGILIPNIAAFRSVGLPAADQYNNQILISAQSAVGCKPGTGTDGISVVKYEAIIRQKGILKKKEISFRQTTPPFDVRLEEFCSETHTLWMSIRSVEGIQVSHMHGLYLIASVGDCNLIQQEQLQKHEICTAPHVKTGFLGYVAVERANQDIQNGLFPITVDSSVVESFENENIKINRKTIKLSLTTHQPVIIPLLMNTSEGLDDVSEFGFYLEKDSSPITQCELAVYLLGAPMRSFSRYKLKFLNSKLKKEPTILDGEAVFITAQDSRGNELAFVDGISHLINNEMKFVILPNFCESCTVSVWFRGKEIPHLNYQSPKSILSNLCIPQKVIIPQHCTAVSGKIDSNFDVFSQDCTGRLFLYASRQFGVGQLEVPLVSLFVKGERSTIGVTIRKNTPLVEDINTLITEGQEYSYTSSTLSSAELENISEFITASRKHVCCCRYEVQIAGKTLLTDFTISSQDISSMQLLSFSFVENVTYSLKCVITEEYTDTFLSINCTLLPHLETPELCLAAYHNGVLVGHRPLVGSKKNTYSIPLRGLTLHENDGNFEIVTSIICVSDLSYVEEIDDSENVTYSFRQDVVFGQLSTSIIFSKRIVTSDKVNLKISNTWNDILVPSNTISHLSGNSSHVKVLISDGVKLNGNILQYKNTFPIKNTLTIPDVRMRKLKPLSDVTLIANTDCLYVIFQSKIDIKEIESTYKVWIALKTCYHKISQLRSKNFSTTRLISTSSPGEYITVRSYKVSDFLPTSHMVDTLHPVFFELRLPKSKHTSNKICLGLLNKKFSLIRCRILESDVNESLKKIPRLGIDLDPPGTEDGKYHSGIIHVRIRCDHEGPFCVKVFKKESTVQPCEAIECHVSNVQVALPSVPGDYYCEVSCEDETIARRPNIAKSKQFTIGSGTPTCITFEEDRRFSNMFFVSGEVKILDSKGRHAYLQQTLSIRLAVIDSSTKTPVSENIFDMTTNNHYISFERLQKPSFVHLSASGGSIIPFSCSLYPMRCGRPIAACVDLFRCARIAIGIHIKTLIMKEVREVIQEMESSKTWKPIKINWDLIDGNYHKHEPVNSVIDHGILSTECSSDESLSEEEEDEFALSFNSATSEGHQHTSIYVSWELGDTLNTNDVSDCPVPQQVLDDYSVTPHDESSIVIPSNTLLINPTPPPPRKHKKSAAILPESVAASLLKSTSRVLKETALISKNSDHTSQDKIKKGPTDIADYTEALFARSLSKYKKYWKPYGNGDGLKKLINLQKKTTSFGKIRSQKAKRSEIVEALYPEGGKKEDEQVEHKIIEELKQIEPAEPPRSPFQELSDNCLEDFKKYIFEDDKPDVQRHIAGMLYKFDVSHSSPFSESVMKTFLYESARKGCSLIFKLLLDLSVDVSMKMPESGMTALHIAAFYCRHEFVRKLIERDPSLVEVRNSSGALPMTYALHCTSKLTPIYQSVVSTDADSSDDEDEGQNQRIPYEYVERRKHTIRHLFARRYHQSNVKVLQDKIQEFCKSSSSFELPLTIKDKSEVQQPSDSVGQNDLIDSQEQPAYEGKDYKLRKEDPSLWESLQDDQQSRRLSRVMSGSELRSLTEGTSSNKKVYSETERKEQSLITWLENLPSTYPEAYTAYHVNNLIKRARTTLSRLVKAGSPLMESTSTNVFDLETMSWVAALSVFPGEYAFQLLLAGHIYTTDIEDKDKPGVNKSSDPKVHAAFGVGTHELFQGKMGLAPYWVMNNAMRKWPDGNDASRRVVKHFGILIERIQVLLHSLPRRPAVVYRGNSADITGDHFQSNAWVWTEFTSTTLKPQVASDFRYGKEGTTLVGLVFTAGSISFCSPYEGEVEYVVPVNTKFDISWKVSRSLLRMMDSPSNMLVLREDVINTTLQQLPSDVRTAELPYIDSAIVDGIRDVIRSLTGYFKKARQTYIDCPGITISDYPIKVRTHISEWLNETNPPNAMCVQGGSSSGKTITALNCLAHCFVENRGRQGKELFPIFISLPTVGDPPRSVLELKNGLDNFIFKTFNLSEQQKDLLVKKYKVVLFLDSLDECDLKWDGSFKNKSFIQLHPWCHENCLVVFTLRKDYLLLNNKTPMNLAPVISQIEIVSFERAETQLLVNSLFRRLQMDLNNEAKIAEQKHFKCDTNDLSLKSRLKAAAIQSRKASTDLRNPFEDLAMRNLLFINPFLMTIAFNVFHEIRDCSENKKFTTTLDNLIFHTHIQKCIRNRVANYYNVQQDLSCAEVEEITNALGEIIACVMLQRRTWVITIEDASAEAITVLDSIPVLSKRKLSGIKELVEQCFRHLPVHVEGSSNTSPFRFSYKSIHEYFAAIGIWRNPEILTSAMDGLSLYIQYPNVVHYFGKEAKRGDQTSKRDENCKKLLKIATSKMFPAKVRSNALCLVAACEVPITGKFNGLTVTGVDFRSALLNEANFENCVFKLVSMEGAIFNDCQLSKTHWDLGSCSFGLSSIVANHGGSVISAACCIDDTIFSIGGDGCVRLWRPFLAENPTSTGDFSPTPNYPQPDCIRLPPSMAIDWSGCIIGTVGSDRFITSTDSSVQVWKIPEDGGYPELLSILSDSKERRDTDEFRPSHWISGMSTYEEDHLEYLMSYGGDNYARIWCLQHYRLIQVIDNEHTKHILTATIANNEFLVTCGEDCTTRVWNLREKRRSESFSTIVHEARSLPNVVACSSNKIILGTRCATILVHMLESGAPAMAISTIIPSKMHYKQVMENMSYSNGQVSDFGYFDLNNDRRFYEPEATVEHHPRYTKSLVGVTALTILLTDRSLQIVSVIGSAIFISTTYDNKQVESLRLGNHDGPITCIAPISHNTIHIPNRPRSSSRESPLESNSRILSTSEDGTIRIWDTVAQTTTEKKLYHTAKINGSCASSTAVLTWCDSTIRLWEVTTGRELRTKPVKKVEPTKPPPYNKSHNTPIRKYPPTESGAIFEDNFGASRLLIPATICALSSNSNIIAHVDNGYKLTLWSINNEAICLPTVMQPKCSKFVFSEDSAILIGLSQRGLLFWKVGNDPNSELCYTHELHSSDQNDKSTSTYFDMCVRESDIRQTIICLTSAGIELWIFKTKTITEITDCIKTNPSIATLICLPYPGISNGNHDVRCSLGTDLIAVLSSDTGTSGSPSRLHSKRGLLLWSVSELFEKAEELMSNEVYQKTPFEGAITIFGDDPTDDISNTINTYVITNDMIPVSRLDYNFETDNCLLNSSIVVTRDDNFICVSYSDKILRFDLSFPDSPPSPFLGHSDAVTSLTLSKSSRGVEHDILVSGSADTTVRFWSPMSQFCLRVIGERHKYPTTFNCDTDGILPNTVGNILKSRSAIKRDGSQQPF